MLPEPVWAIVVPVVALAIALLVAAYLVRRHGRRITEAEHFELWTEEMWPGSGSYAARVDELAWFEAWEGRP